MALKSENYIDRLKIVVYYNYFFLGYKGRE
ncbi:Uncharacterised protein [[Eubacterium] contortum]|uniref:Uncharacterized protein n=1 Tax=Faecalicatena contorta TaxID=39482 RepID=A0A174G6Q1_9FIRM|nr:Uncharacterised protein [[Eubacterium] contortum] [Faecalicatena contorta]